MRAAVLCLVLTAGCYAPSPPGGSYLCSTEGACPDNLHCKCNQCVATDNQAACSFRITPSKDPLQVREHAGFSINVQALDEKGLPASGFRGDVTLSSSWGDVCVGATSCASAPKTVSLVAGSADTMVSLNRETVAPQNAVLFADFAGRRGSSESARINVQATPFTRAGNPIPRVGPLNKFGVIDILASMPQVEYIGGKFRMYFGALSSSFQSGSAIAVATSTDGVTFDPASVSEVFHQPQAGAANVIGFPSLLVTTTGDHRLLYSVGDTGIGGKQIGLATSTDGLGAFVDQGLILSASQCDFCGTAFQPGSVIVDPFPQLSGNGSAGGYIAFLTGVAPSTDASGIPSIAIGRAISHDDQSFDFDSDALLTNATQLGKGEFLLVSPRVLLDGSVLKMWYSYATLPPTSADPMNAGKQILNPCAPLTLGRIEVGYATSQDGYTWSRSAVRRSGAAADAPGDPVLGYDGSAGSWDSFASSLYVSSVLPTDGKDPSNGITLYYSAFFNETFGPEAQAALKKQGLTGFPPSNCVLNGVGRATRP